ncbi:E3 UFM1-protein ligase 1 homolog [Anopheles maculipalpis]|uniref:E3 UFM1-protein ligase 1 homolog n=1 Tax=Anopheles maculipalpis TaxID=1496333 RepID=UPI002158B521|nr:E3 UFM1-protein ligase 1 homolog [Anopheles maculipalpis]
MADWDEIKRLAADFQKAQLSTSLQRLSERNCIEIVRLLIDKGLIDVIYTNDGKEYLTQDHLQREVKDELYVRGGRANLIELAKVLNVDFGKIEYIAKRLIDRDPELHFLLGQLIEKSYIDRVASEINQKLVQYGEINIGQLTVTYDLPTDFILEKIVLANLNKIIFAKQDPTNGHIFFTQSYIMRNKAKIRGALAAITKPTPISVILNLTDVPARILYMSLNEMSSLGSVTVQSPAGQYIPHVYERMQADYVKDYFHQNGYITHETVTKLGVSDVRSFVRTRLPDEKLTNMKNCIVSNRLIERVKDAMEVCISSNSYLDLSTLLPSGLSNENIEEILTHILTPTIRKQTYVFGTVVLTINFMDECVKGCQELVNEHAKRAVESGNYQKYMAEKMMQHQDANSFALEEEKVDKREERRKKAASGKVGGGAQGRETKTKSTKKHARGNRGNAMDSDDEGAEMASSAGGKKGGKEPHLELITVKEIAKVVEKILEPEGLEMLDKDLANHYYPILSKQALAKAHELYELTLQKSNQNRRQTHASIQEKLNTLYNDIRLYEKGLKLFPTDVQGQLLKYLLKTFGTDICNEICLYVAAECNLNTNFTGALTAEQRTKIANDSGAEYRAPLQTLCKSVTTSESVEDFLEKTEKTMQACSMMLKKIDKKKDRNLILCHKHGLLEQLTNCTDPALVLHLAVLIIFTISTQTMLHASGRHVSAILSFLQTVLTAEDSKTFNNYHDLVLKLLSTENVNSEEGKANAEEITKQLGELTPVVKSIATNFKKAGVTAVE